MTVEELIGKLQTLPVDATVKCWDPYRDDETDEVYVSCREDGAVFVLNAVLGREV